MAYTNIDFPAEYFNTVLWTGDGSNPRSITGVGFQPDLVWLKTRSLTGQAHQWVDVVRGYGTSAMNTIYSNQAVAEESDESNTGLTVAYGNIQSLNSDGFTVDSGISSSAQTNQSSATYASWNWKANGAGVSNTSGTISSTVSANTTSGFSIVSYTGTGANATVGHGLGVAPNVVIIKERTSAGEWVFGHSSLGFTKFIEMNSTGASQTNSTRFNDTAPTSSVFSIGTALDVNTSGNAHIAYCFAEVKGYSKFGSYTGNGSADGSFLYLGFRPSWLLIKRTDSAGYDWLMYDNKRQVPFNVVDDFLNPNSDAAETTGNANQSLDFLSNGVKFRGNGASSNGSGASYIYMAFAENPFVTSTSIPTTAR
jgi:hypothetical protein